MVLSGLAQPTKSLGILLTSTIWKRCWPHGFSVFSSESVMTMNQRVSLSATCAVSLCFVDIASVVRQIVNRAVCGVRSFHIHGSVRPTTAWKYTNWRQAFFASPIRCKSIRNLPLKLYCVFLALCVCCQNPSRRRTASGRGRMLTPYYHVARPSPLLNVSSCK